MSIPFVKFYISFGPSMRDRKVNSHVLSIYQLFSCVFHAVSRQLWVTMLARSDLGLSASSGTSSHLALEIRTLGTTIYSRICHITVSFQSSGFSFASEVELQLLLRPRSIFIIQGGDIIPSSDSSLLENLGTGSRI